MPQLQNKLQDMKLEIAAEFGLADYDNMDKGELSSRMNGKIGGEMTRRLIELGKMQLAHQAQRELVPIRVKREHVAEQPLMLPWPEAYNEELLPLSTYHAPNRRFY